MRDRPDARQHLEPFGDVVRVDVVHPLAADFRNPAGMGRDADLSMAEALPDRQPPSLGPTREHRHEALAIQQVELDVRHVVEDHDPVIEVVARLQLLHEVLDEPSPAADEDQRRDVRPAGADHPLPYVEEVGWVLARLDGPDAQHVWLLGDALDERGDGRSGGRGRGQLVRQRHDADWPRRQAARGQVRDEGRLVVLRRRDEEIGEGQRLDEALGEYPGVPDIEVFGIRDGQDVMNEHADDAAAILHVLEQQPHTADAPERADVQKDLARPNGQRRHARAQRAELVVQVGSGLGLGAHPREDVQQWRRLDPAQAARVVQRDQAYRLGRATAEGAHDLALHALNAGERHVVPDVLEQIGDVGNRSPATSAPLPDARFLCADGRAGDACRAGATSPCGRRASAANRAEAGITHGSYGSNRRVWNDGRKHR